MVAELQLLWPWAVARACESRAAERPYSDVSLQNLCLAAPASLMSHHCIISLTLELRELSLTEFRNQNKYMSEYQLKT